MVNKESYQKIQGIKNWNIERMKVEKHKGNILTDKDYVDRGSKDVNAAMGLQKNNNNNNNNKRMKST